MIVMARNDHLLKRNIRDTRSVEYRWNDERDPGDRSDHSDHPAMTYDEIDTMLNAMMEAEGEAEETDEIDDHLISARAFLTTDAEERHEIDGYTISTHGSPGTGMDMEISSEPSPIQCNTEADQFNLNEDPADDGSKMPQDEDQDEEEIADTSNERTPSRDSDSKSKPEPEETSKESDAVESIEEIMRTTSSKSDEFRWKDSEDLQAGPARIASDAEDVAMQDGDEAESEENRQEELSKSEIADWITKVMMEEKGRDMMALEMLNLIEKQGN